MCFSSCVPTLRNISNQRTGTTWTSEPEFTRINVDDVSKVGSTSAIIRVHRPSSSEMSSMIADTACAPVLAEDAILGSVDDEHWMPSTAACLISAYLA